ncbi:hypothetical protein BaRGS_00014900, partial [Batillaria attramentaria]
SLRSDQLNPDDTSSATFHFCQGSCQRLTRYMNLVAHSAAWRLSPDLREVTDCVVIID